MNSMDPENMNIDWQKIYNECESDFDFQLIRRRTKEFCAGPAYSIVNQVLLKKMKVEVTGCKEALKKARGQVRLPKKKTKMELAKFVKQFDTPEEGCEKYKVLWENDQQKYEEKFKVFEFAMKQLRLAKKKIAEMYAKNEVGGERLGMFYKYRVASLFKLADKKGEKAYVDAQEILLKHYKWIQSDLVARIIFDKNKNGFELEGWGFTELTERFIWFKILVWKDNDVSAWVRRVYEARQAVEGRVNAVTMV